MGAWVYVNAVGFLRVRLSGMLAASSISSQFFALLDDTRIHPDLYCFAEQMARDVYGDMDVLVQSIRDLPSYLEKLDIEAYARSTGLHYMMQTLCCIREELIQGFQEWRKKYEEPSDDDMFYMMTGETRDTLSEGSIVQATIRRVLSKTAICTVGAGLICLLWRDDFKVDRREISDLSQVMKVGDTITCKIKSLRKKQWDVKLSSF
ncbi:putative transcription elongation factor Spt6, DNA ligase B, RNA-binding domain, S1 [Rosa chinensis]|uniref:Putative transcription elongation factor Spt6, DNA ligase B, RNA-binding domain, S1 n=1 Tax=Rosa chinensis TaxID=74649 RepID=A0A2P6RIV7_ROSCH|nr:putative transcription elongation factor Spt6, DNA ligase B, RNA-binding domain, S1 [Rosa chinensis]